MAAAPPKDDVVLASFATLSILQLIKDAQQRHGLRHGDYQRYRGYCARRVKRIRKSLGYTHLHKSVPKHPAKFYQKKIISDIVSEDRYLQVAVFDAERNWSYAMQLKYEAGEDPHSRKRYHMVAKLRKAVKHTSNLESIVRQCSRADTATKLEAQAYNAWMYGCLLFEEKGWKKALEYLKTAKTIYEKLSGVVKDSELINLYKARCREIQPQIRYCEFTSGGDAKNTDEAMSEMINMRLKLGGEEGTLQDDFDKLIAEMRAKAVLDHDVAIAWSGRKIPVTCDAVRQLMQATEQFDSQLQLTGSHDDKLALYEQLLSGIRDTIQKLNDESKKAVGDANATNTQQTLIYLDFLRLSRTVERYVLIINYTRSQPEKRPKPQDLVRLYDSVIENCKEVLELEDIETNPLIKDAYEAKIEFYLAFRCFYMAEACAALSKFEEAAVLFDRAADRSAKACKIFGTMGNNPHVSESKEELKELSKQISLAKYAAQANRLAEAANEEKEAEENRTVDTRSLIDTLDEYRVIKPEDLQKTDSPVSVVSMPPNFIPMPNKPMFFDLALNHVKMPDLEAKIASFAEKTPVKQPEVKKAKGAAAKGAQQAQQEEQQGISGLVKGWFWGKK